MNAKSRTRIATHGFGSPVSTTPRLVKRDELEARREAIAAARRPAPAQIGVRMPRGADEARATFEALFRPAA